MEIFLFLYIKGVFHVLIFDSDYEHVCLYAGPVIRFKMSVKKIREARPFPTTHAHHSLILKQKPSLKPSNMSLRMDCLQ